MTNKYFPGLRWNTFDDPVEAFVGTSANERSISRLIIEARSRSDVVLVCKLTDHPNLAVCLTKSPDGRWDRWACSFERLYDSPEEAKQAGEHQWRQPDKSNVVSAFKWNALFTAYAL